MLEDDFELPKKGDSRNLEIMGIEELRDYIKHLEQEIEQVKKVLAQKEEHQKVADSLFRKP